MKKHFAMAVIITAITLSTSVYLLSRGIIRLNYPSESEFPVRGIDVSHHQGQVNWWAVAADDIRFAYIKASEGESFRDKRFAENWSGALRVGIIPGAYHFYSLCKSPEVQAANFLAAAPPVAGTILPPAVDLELGGNCAHRPTPESFRNNLARFLELVEAAWGSRAILYTTSEFYPYLEDHFPWNPLWVRSVFTEPRWAGFGAWDIWQYANRGRVQGISTFVDLNVYGESWPHFRTWISTATISGYRSFKQASSEYEPGNLRGPGATAAQCMSSADREPDKEAAGWVDCPVPAAPMRVRME